LTLAADRFFDIEGADDPQEMAPGGGDEAGRPFARPIYWGAFVLTGL
jgi:CHAT domain-containing protein